MTDTTGRTIRIESALETDRKTHALHHTKIYAGDVDITNDVISIDWHADATSAPTATIQIYTPALDAEAAETEFTRTDGTPPEPETLTKHDLGLHKLALVGQGEQIKALAGRLETLRVFDSKLDTAAENMTDVRDQLDELTNDITALREQLAGAVQQLQQLIIQTAPACATCYTEERGGTRPGHNLANAVIDGTGYCHEHVDVVNGRLVPKKSSGLIITGG